MPNESAELRDPRNDRFQPNGSTRLHSAWHIMQV